MRRDRGQIVLILVLITVVGLTIGLSMISRTITDIRMSSQIEQSSRAFSAAEAGIETALRSNIAIGPTGSVSLDGASANYKVKTIGGNTDDIILPVTQVGGSQTVWLIDHNSDGTINEGGDSYPINQQLEICFNNLNNSSAISVSILYKEGNEYKVAKRAYDSDIGDGNGQNLIDATNFGVGGGFCNGQYFHRVIIMPSSDAVSGTDDFQINQVGTILLFLRLQPIYETTAFTVSPSVMIPVQGRIISSVGQTVTNVVRKIEVFQGFSILPNLLDFAFFSEN